MRTTAAVGTFVSDDAEAVPLPLHRAASRGSRWGRILRAGSLCTSILSV